MVNSSSQRRGRRLSVPTIVALACLAAGCGSTVNQDRRVASVPPARATTSQRAASHRGATTVTNTSGAGATSGVGATSVGSARPVLRLDDSPQRRAALYNVYSACLLHHGAHRATSGMAAAVGVGRDKGILVQQPIPVAAEAACVGVLPRQPPQLQSATNPHFHSQSLAYVACLRRSGVWVRLLNGHNLDWTFLAGHPDPGDEAAVENRCLLRAFGGR